MSDPFQPCEKNLKITKQDMDGFIADKYEELVKEKEEDEDD